MVHDNPPHAAPRPPRPQPHRRASGPTESRRIPPHGDVSPDGSRAWPNPSPTAKWLVWGGTAVAAAALTAGTVIAARQLLGAASGPRRRIEPERTMAPRFADLTPEERAAMRSRVHARDDEDARRIARMRAEAAHDAPRREPPPPPGPRLSFMQEIEANTASLQKGVERMMLTLDAALAGFRTVASQTSSILREFEGAAGTLRGIFGGEATPTPKPKPAPKPRPAAAPASSGPSAGAASDPPMPGLRDDPLTREPLDGPETAGPADHNPRLHRL